MSGRDRRAGCSPAQATERLSALHSGRGDVYLHDSGPELAWRLVLCRDNDFRIRDYNAYRAARERVAKAAPHVRYNSQALDTVLGCQGWASPKRPSEQAKGALPPVLVVNALHDVATPLAGARCMADLFPRASLLTVDTVGHGMYGLDAPTRAIDAYPMKGKPSYGPSGAASRSRRFQQLSP